MGGCSLAVPGPIFPIAQQGDQLASIMDFRLPQTAQTRNTKTSKDQGIEGHPRAEAHSSAPRGQQATTKTPAVATMCRVPGTSHAQHTDSFNAHDKPDRSAVTILSL